MVFIICNIKAPMLVILQFFSTFYSFTTDFHFPRFHFVHALKPTQRSRRSNRKQTITPGNGRIQFLCYIGNRRNWTSMKLRRGGRIGQFLEHRYSAGGACRLWMELIQISGSVGEFRF